MRTMILARGELAFVIVNSFPYNPGHLMVAPFRHVGAFTSLEAAELADVDALVARSIRALEQEMEPHGYNLGMNLGRVAGAGIPDHVHWHARPSLERRHELHAGRRADRACCRSCSRKRTRGSGRASRVHERRFRGSRGSRRDAANVIKVERFSRPALDPSRSWWTK